MVLFWLACASDVSRFLEKKNSYCRIGEGGLGEFSLV